MLCFIAATMCVVAAIERPDRQNFWLACCYIVGVTGLLSLVIGVEL